jgi:hypothetical protein
MLLKEHKELKEAIIQLPQKEKDKILLRLIAKDKVLTEHLHFNLLEDASDLDQRFGKLKDEIDVAVSLLKDQRKYSSKDTLTMIRKLNGRINHHFKVTKDLNTEIELRVYLLNMVPLTFEEAVFSAGYKFQEKLNTYFLKTTLALFKKIGRLHEDLQYDFKSNFDAILNRIENSKMAAASKELGLPKEL